MLLRKVSHNITKWRPAQILESVLNRSYIVQNDQGNTVRRNRASIQATTPAVNKPKKSPVTGPEPQPLVEQQETQQIPVTSSNGRQIRPLMPPDY